jgi:DNA-binding HxlR family transcriptional regulator
VLISFIVATYGRKLKQSKSGWSEELKNLNRQLNKLAREGWVAKEIVPTPSVFDVIYTILLEKHPATTS